MVQKFTKIWSLWWVSLMSILLDPVQRYFHEILIIYNFSWANNVIGQKYFKIFFNYCSFPQLIPQMHSGSRAIHRKQQFLRHSLSAVLIGMKSTTVQMRQTPRKMSFCNNEVSHVECSDGLPPGAVENFQ